MDLTEFSSGYATGTPKPWLLINAGGIRVSPGGGGGPRSVTIDAYSQIAPTVISNTSAISSLADNSAAVGSLSVGPLPVGAVVRLKALANLTYTAGGGFNMYLRLNGATTLVSFSNSFASSSLTDVQMVWDATVTVLPSGMAVAGLTVSIPGAGLGGENSASFALNPATSNSFDFAINFTTAAVGNNLNCTMYYAEVLNST